MATPEQFEAESYDGLKKGDNPEQMVTERLKDHILHTPAAQPPVNPKARASEEVVNPPQVLKPLEGGKSHFDGSMKVGDNPDYMATSHKS